MQFSLSHTFWDWKISSYPTKTLNMPPEKLFFMTYSRKAGQLAISGVKTCIFVVPFTTSTFKSFISSQQDFAKNKSRPQRYRRGSMMKKSSNGSHSSFMVTLTLARENDQALTACKIVDSSFDAALTPTFEKCSTCNSIDRTDSSRENITRQDGYGLQSARPDGFHLLRRGKQQAHPSYS